MHPHPIIVVGSGIAGIYTALKLAPLPVIVVTPMLYGKSGSSYLAQGGIAAAIAPDDAPEFHMRDTILAGAGLVDESVARIMTAEAPAAIADLESMGVIFDTDTSGHRHFAREAAHSRARVLHLNGDNTGYSLMEVLRRLAAESPHITMMDGYEAMHLHTENNEMQGIWLADKQHRLSYLPTNRVVLASGGLAGIFAITTTPRSMLGQGIGMAALAGATIMDPEFVQFHPTALYTQDDTVPLLTEALRGAGAFLVNEQGTRIMSGLHADLEMAPRDIVARAVYAQMAAGHQVYLDAREAIGNSFAQHFPTVYTACVKAGIEPSEDIIPITPAAHYHIGGIATDMTGESTVKGLYACGETACTGLHGANRLASNSLLEALVIGKRIALAMHGTQPHAVSSGEPTCPAYEPHQGASPWPPIRALATRSLGIIRNGAAIARGQSELTVLLDRHRHDIKLRNALLALMAAMHGALLRQESRGCHYREDYPERAEPAHHTRLRWQDGQFQNT